MRLTNKQELPLSGESIGYDGHKNKSCKLKLIPSGGILIKDKERSTKKALHEFLALSAWQLLLENYNQKTDESLSITSPYPYKLDKRGRLYMEFLPGVSVDSSLSGNYIRGKNCPTRDKARLDFSRRLGRLLRIKEIERLAHFDFQLRHLIQNMSPQLLSVIDVENSKVNSEQVNLEHAFIRSQIDRVFVQSDNLKKKVEMAMEEGYESVLDDYPVLPYVEEQLLKNLGFHEKQVERFMK